MSIDKKDNLRVVGGAFQGGTPSGEGSPPKRFKDLNEANQALEVLEQRLSVWLQGQGLPTDILVLNPIDGTIDLNMAPPYLDPKEGTPSAELKKASDLLSDARLEFEGDLSTVSGGLMELEG